MAGPKREYRQVTTSATIDDVHEGRITADVVSYNKLDDYGTTFKPGCFTESMSKRMPKICWGHDWKDPIGRWTEVDDSSSRLRMVGELDINNHVPSADRAYAQLRSGTIDQFSVGFVRQVDEKGKVPGTFDIVRALLDEASPVLVGAVPGTKLVSIRSTRNAPRLTRAGVPAGTSLWVPSTLMQDILVRYERGELDLGDAISELKGASMTYDELPTEEEPDEEEEDPEEEEEEEFEEEEEDPVPEIPEDLDAALAEMGLVANDV